MNNNSQLDLNKINALIKKKNKLFKKSTKAQQRVMVAKDVLAQIEANKYKPDNGIWVKYKLNKENKLSGEESVQKLFAENQISSCDVCALGGLFMSCTNLNNTTTLNNLNSETADLGSLIDYNEELSNKLNEIFTKSQLMLIESYFEDNGGMFFDGDENCFIYRFNEKYTHSKDRMIAIMKNIVENKGTFRPRKFFSNKEIKEINAINNYE